MPIRPRIRRRRLECLLAATFVLLGQLLSARRGHAQNNPVHVDCPTLTKSDLAELETRVRASLLLWGDEPPHVRVTCNDGMAEVEVRYASRVTTTVISMAANDWDDRLLGVIDSAQRLSQPKAAVQQSALRDVSVREPAVHDIIKEPTTNPRGPKVRRSFVYLRPGFVVVEGKEPASEPLEVSAPPVPVAAGPPNSLAATAVAEYWARDLALGLHGSATRRFGRLRYGLAASGLFSTESYRGFRAFEGAVAGQVAIRLPHVPLYALAAAGVSALYLRPNGAFQPSERRYLTYPYAELGLELPFSEDGLGLVVAAGVRLFEKSRQVNADDIEQLRLPVAVPRVMLGVTYGW